MLGVMLLPASLRAELECRSQFERSELASAVVVLVVMMPFASVLHAAAATQARGAPCRACASVAVASQADTRLEC